MNASLSEYRQASSSPPSSPSPLCDSSPPSSPSLHAELDIWEPQTVLDPLAGAARATRLPPLYEKKHEAVDGPPAKKARHIYEVEFHPSKSFTPRDKEATALPRDSQQMEDPADLLWEAAVDKVVTEGQGTIQLDGQNICRIPDRCLEDLANFFVPARKDEAANTKYRPPADLLSPPGGRLFTRVTTAPINGPDVVFLREAPERTRTAGDLFGLGLPRDEIHLFLSRNSLRSLPLKLFTLRRLRVLILRANQLSFLPPEISQLHHLRELNIAGNNLRYLPSEMLNMSLENLHIHPNPFLNQPEPATRSFARIKSTPWGWRAGLGGSDVGLAHKRIVSPPTSRLPRVVPVFELCLRRALQFHRSSFSPDLLPPYEMQYFPPHIRELLSTCGLGYCHNEPESSFQQCQLPVKRAVSTSGPVAHFPGGPAMTEHEDDSRITGVGICPSPRHGEESVFVMHAEERYTWEDTVAGVRVGGTVPLRWRGCQWGCLDFLDKPLEPQDKPSAELGDPGGSCQSQLHLGEPTFNAGAEPNVDVAMGKSEPEDDEAVRVVNIGGQASLSLSDFED